LLRLATWLLLAGWCAGAAGAGSVSDCAGALAGRQEHDTFPIRECPSLASWLSGASWPLTEPEVDATITPAQLHFLQRAQRVAEARVVVERGALLDLLGEVRQPESPDPGDPWRKAVQAWLDRLKGHDLDLPLRWLQGVLEALTPSPATARALFYLALGSLVAVSLGLVLREMHHAGWLPRRWRRRGPAAGMRAAAVSTVAEPGSAAGGPPRRELAVLLESVIAAVTARGILPADATLTHRQLLCAASGQAGEIGALRRLLETAEPLLYGRQTPGPDQLAAFHRAGQSLLVRSQT